MAMLMSHLFIVVLCFCGMFVHGRDFCNVDVSYSCDLLRTDGFCSNKTAKVPFAPIKNTTFDDNGFISNSNPFKMSNFLQPVDALYCWNNTCCGDPCDPNPCYNGGTCLNETKTGNAFECSCMNGYRGDWCQESDTCGSKTCGENATCVDEKCECKEGFVGDGFFCKESCSRFTIDSHLIGCRDNFTFEPAEEYATQYSTEKCSDGRSIASIKCKKSEDGGNPSGLSFDMSTISCFNCSLDLDTFISKQKISKNIDEKDIEEETEKLQLLTSATNKGEKAVKNVVNYLDNMLESLKTLNATDPPKKISERTMENVLLVVENLEMELPVNNKSESIKNNLEPKYTESDKSRELRTTTRKTFKLIDNFARLVEANEFTIRTAKKLLKSITPTTTASATFEPVMYVKSLENNATTSLKKKTVVRMNIPPEALQRLAKLAAESGENNLKLVFVLHQDSSLLTLDERTGRVVQATYKTDKGVTEEHISIGTTFSIAFEHPKTVTPAQKETVNGTLMKVISTYICVFWDFLHEKWETQGCTFHEKGFYCECEHFTSFALMLRVNIDYPVFEPDWYSIIMCILSILGLLATIIIYLSIKELRSRRPTPILINICFNLMLGFLVFVIGMDGRSPYKDYSDVACYVFAVIMHVTFLCSWFWMLIYSLNIYYALVKIVGPSPFVSKKGFMYVLGYAVPILIVAIDLIVSFVMDSQRDLTDPNEKDTDKSYYIANHICWVRHYSMYIGFAAPVGSILLINTVLFAVTIRKLTWKRKEIRSSKEKTDSKQQIFMAITMMSMMGITWIFGFVMLLSGDKTVLRAFSIMFNIFNTAQGVVIFLASCIRQEAVRHMWMTPIQKVCGCYKPKKDKRARSLPFESGDTSGFSTLPRSSKGALTTTQL